jgi:hypothetical protein
MLAKVMIEARRFTAALRNYVRLRKQRKIVALFGKIEFDPKYDYKKQRRKS